MIGNQCVTICPHDPFILSQLVKDHGYLIPCWFDPHGVEEGLCVNDEVIVVKFHIEELAGCGDFADGVVIFGAEGDKGHVGGRSRFVSVECDGLCEVVGVVMCGIGSETLCVEKDGHVGEEEGKGGEEEQETKSPRVEQLRHTLCDDDAPIYKHFLCLISVFGRICVTCCKHSNCALSFLSENDLVLICSPLSKCSKISGHVFTNNLHMSIYRP